MNVETNLERSHRLAAAFQPPKKLDEVVTPGSLASFIGPEAWGPVRELARDLDTAREDLKRIEAKIEEVKDAIYWKGARRVVDVHRMAEAALRGEVPREEQPAAPLGLAALSGQALADLKAGLLGKEREARDHVTWLEGRLNATSRDLARDALVRVAERYGEIMGDAARLHTLLDAGQEIVGRGVVPQGWRQEKFLAPTLGKMARLPDDLGAMVDHSYVARFDKGSGIAGIRDEWLAAVKAATGRDVK